MSAHQDRQLLCGLFPGSGSTCSAVSSAWSTSCRTSCRFSSYFCRYKELPITNFTSRYAPPPMRTQNRPGSAPALSALLPQGLSPLGLAVPVGIGIIPVLPQIYLSWLDLQCLANLLADLHYLCTTDGAGQLFLTQPVLHHLNRNVSGRTSFTLPDFRFRT